MRKNQIYNRKNIYKNELRRLTEAEISESNSECIIRFHNYLRANKNSEQRIVKLSSQLRKIAKILDKSFESATRQDIEKVLAEIYTSTYTRRGQSPKSYSPSTKKDYGRILKQFYRWIEGTEKIPDRVAWIDTKLAQNESILNMELITWDDINKCTEVADNPKDVAFINFIYEAGPRIGEMLNMKISDVIFNKQYAKVRLVGKTGERWIPIVISTPYLAQYLNTHPKNNDTDFFWLSSSDKNRNTPLKYTGAVMLIRKLFRKAGISKRCNCHSFRHSRATDLATKLTEPQLRLFFGWTRSSDTPSFYCHLSGRDLESPILALNGIGDEEETENNKPVICTLCKNVNKPKSSFCSSCGYGLSVKSVLDAEVKAKEEVNKTIEYFMELSKNPQLLAEFQKFKREYESRLRKG